MLRPVDSTDRYGQFANSSSNVNNDPKPIPKTAAPDDDHSSDANRVEISNLIAEAQRCITKNHLGLINELGIEAIQRGYEEIADEINLMQIENIPNEGRLIKLIEKKTSLEDCPLDSLYKTAAPAGFCDLCYLYRQLRGLFDKDLSILHEKMAQPSSVLPDSPKIHPQFYSPPLPKPKSEEEALSIFSSRNGIDTTIPQPSTHENNVNNAGYPPPATSNMGMDLIENHIRDGDNKEAVKKLLFQLLDPKILNLEKAFDYLLALFPHIDEDENFFRRLLLRLPNFLKLTSHLPEQQNRLALLLGKALCKRKAYLVAMSCFAQALKIGQQRNDLQLQRDAHFSMSELLRSVIQNQFLSLDSFKKKLDKCRGEGKASEFGNLLEGIKSLKQYCHSEESVKFIRDLFTQALDVLDDRGAPGEFQSFVGEITFELACPIPLAKLCITERYQQALNEFRGSFAALPEFKDLRLFQKQVTEKFRGLLYVFLEDAFTVLGDPPCAYDIRAIGSVGREEPGPFSDLEFFLLIESEVHRQYFTTLLHFLEFQVMSLGETESQEMVFTCLNVKGFYLDKGSSPLKISDLMGPPQKIAALQQRPLVTSNEDEKADLTAVPSNQVLKSISLLKNHPTKLFSECQKAMVEILDSGDELQIRHSRALQLFETRCIDFEKTWEKNTRRSDSVGVKEGYVQFLNFFLADLSLYFGVQATNTLDIIDALVEKNAFTAPTGDLLKEAVSLIYRLRIKEQEEGYSDDLSSKISQLEKIHWLILTPLYTICLPRVLEEKEPVESVFNNLDLISVSLDEVCATEKPSLILIPLVQGICFTRLRHIATHMSKEPIETHIAIFKKLSKRSDQEDLRELYLKVLEENHLEEDKLKKIREIPNRAGYRPSFLKRQNDLKAQIEAITAAEISDLQFDPKAKWTPRVMVRTSKGIRYLKPEIAREIIDTKSGDLKKGYDGSGHLVTSAAMLHFKQKPTHPLMEYAIHSLFFRLAGELTPPTELVRFEVDGRKPYPVLISATVPGETLKMRLETSLKLEKPQWARWTWMLLCSILTRPGDGRLSNYVMDPQDNIFCIDNDISFAEPFVQEFASSQVKFYSALFCLGQNSGLDSKVLKDFCDLDADTILLSWIEDVIQKEAEYSNLFSEEEEKRLHDEDPKNRFKVPVEFREGTLATLITQFIYLQNQLSARLQQNKIPTPAELLKYIIALSESPHLMNLPGENVSRRYLKANHPSIEERLQWILSLSHGQSMTSIQSDQICLGRKKNPSFEEVKKKRLFSADKAKEELLWSTLQRSPHFLTEGTVHRKKVTQANFKEFWADGKPALERQRNALLALTFRLRGQLPSSLALQHCAVLNTELLDPFLHQDLEYLDLSYCPMIKNSDMAMIAKKCPKLKELYLSGCIGLTILEGGRVFSEPLFFSSLQIFYINKCPNLKRISLRTPCLRLLNGDNNPRLNRVERMCFLEFEPSLKNCLKLTENIFYPLALESLNQEAFNDREFMLSASTQNSHALQYAGEELKRDREFVLATVTKNGEALQYASEELKRDREFVLTAVTKNGEALQYASEELKKDREFVLTAVTKNGEALQYASEELKRDREFVLTAVAEDALAFEFASEELKSDRQFVLAAVTENGYAFAYAPEELKSDRQFVLAAMTENGYAFAYAPEELKRDREFVLAAVTQNGKALKYASEELKMDRELVLAAVTQSGKALKYASEELKMDREFVLATVTKNWYALDYASKELKRDRELVLAAVTQNGKALKYASEELQRDKEFVLAAASQNWYTLECASEELKRDREFVLAAVTKNGFALGFASEELKSDREIVLVAVTNYRWALEYAGEELKGDRELVLTAVSKDGKALEYASEELKMDREVVLAAVTQNGYALEHTNEELKRDRGIVQAAVTQYGMALEYASKELKRDRELVLAAVTKSGRALEYASEELKSDREIVFAAVTQNREAFKYASEELKRDREFVLTAVYKDGCALEFASEELKRDRELVCVAVYKDGRALEFASEELKRDRELVLVAVYKDGRALEFASEELKRDREFVLVAVYKDGSALEFASEELKRDREFVLVAVYKDGSALEFASEELKSDREIVLAALTKSGYTLKYACEELKNDKDIVLAAVTQNGWALQFASEELKSDREIVLAAMTNINALQFASEELKNDRAFVLAAVTKNGYALDFASEELKNDREVAIAAVTQNGDALRYASEELTKNREMVLAAVTQNGVALEYASEEFKKDREVVLAAMTSNGYAFMSASEELKMDREVVHAAVTNCGWALKYASEELQRDREFVLAAVTKNASALQYASEKLQRDREFVLAAVTENGLALEFASEELCRDRELVLAAVTKNGFALGFASEELKNDREIVLAAVTKNGNALEYASEELKKDRELVLLAAVTNYGLALKYASEELKKDREVVLAAESQSGEVFGFESEEVKPLMIWDLYSHDDFKLTQNEFEDWE